MSPEDGPLERELAAVRARESEYRQRLAEQRERSTRLAETTARIRDVLRHGRPATPARLLAEVAALSSRALAIERTSIWLFDDAQRTLACRVLLVRGIEVADEWTSIPASACPTYIRALGTAGAVAVSNAAADARTSELSEYLRENGVGALLDIPLLVPGGIMGVVCHEHVGGPREWHDEEVDFAAAVGGLVAVALEAERRVAAERSARGTEARYQHLVESLPVTVYAFDARTGQLDYLSPNIGALTGLGPEHWTLERATASWLSIIEPAHRPDVERRLSGAAPDQLIEELVYPIRVARADGATGPTTERRWIRDTLGVVRDSLGRPILVQGMFADITALRETELARAEVERRYRTLLENIELIAVILDRKGQVEFVNDYLLRLTGFSRAEVIGTSWFELTRSADRRQRAAAVHADAIASGVVPPRHESTLRPRQGRERRIAWTNTVLKDAEGRVTGTSSLGLDITDRLELEAMQLQSRKVESLGRLAAHVAHDFNNLLTVIAGSVESLADRTDPNDRDALASVEAAVSQATELTQSLLDYGRSATPAIVRQALDDVVRSAQPILRRLAHGTDLTLAVDLAADEAEVDVDPNQLRQVLVNLVTNAVDATRGHGRHVRVSTTSVELGQAEARALGLAGRGGFVQIAVSDDGVGVGDATRQRIFEPFFTTKAPGRGTGLGLALCDSIVRRAGGAIAVLSEPGHGATFRVYLPRASAPSAESDVAPFAEKV